MRAAASTRAAARARAVGRGRRGGRDRSARVRKGCLRDLLKPLGVDITDKRFWQKGFDVIGEMMAELEKS